MACPQLILSAAAVQALSGLALSETFSQLFAMRHRYHESDRRCHIVAVTLGALYSGKRLSFNYPKGEEE